jgi:EAL domain-containing protein (putative c-di-GMP-specific phosphodiesterase class I)
LGARIALDDFGTGYSSLSYLKKFPIDRLKIDHSFVKDAVVDKDSEQIISAIIAMAHSLKLEIIAEGVEEPAQIEMLTRLDCHYAQGYLISYPLPEEKLLRYCENFDAQLILRQASA